MGLFGKPTISEKDAAGRFVLSILRGVRETWPQITGQFSPFLDSDAEQLQSPWAQFEFGVASIAIQIQALQNLLPTDQARRVRGYIVACLSAPDLGSVPVESLAAYERAWLDAPEQGEMPFNAVASVLYDHLGLDCSVTVGGARLKDPLLIMAMGGAVTTFGGPWWKSLISKYRLVA